MVETRSMRQITISLEDRVYEALAREGPTPEVAARRRLEHGIVENGGAGEAAWEALEAGLGDAAGLGNLSDSIDDALYRAGC